MDCIGKNHYLTMCSDYLTLPKVVVHADWSTHPGKRWMALAILSEEGYYAVSHPERVGDPITLLSRLRKIAGGERLILLGFDFPIGFPLEYAKKVGVTDFVQLLPNLGQGKWKDFFNVAETYPTEIYTHLGIKFSPAHPGRRSGKRAQNDRQANAAVLLNWAEKAEVKLTPTLDTSIRSGFGSQPEGEDPFDAIVGLFGMLNIVLGFRIQEEPVEDNIRYIEGWILGQPHEDNV